MIRSNTTSKQILLLVQPANNSELVNVQAVKDLPSRINNQGNRKLQKTNRAQKKIIVKNERLEQLQKKLENIVQKHLQTSRRATELSGKEDTKKGQGRMDVRQ